MGSDGSFSGPAFPGQDDPPAAGRSISSDSEKRSGERKEETALGQLLTAYSGKLGCSFWDPSPANLPSDPSVSARPSSGETGITGVGTLICRVPEREDGIWAKG